MHSNLVDNKHEIPVILGTDNDGDYIESLHLMQIRVLDEVDVEIFDEIAALLNSVQAIAPAAPDLPHELLNLSFTECSKHDRQGNLSAHGQFSIKSHPGRERAKGGEETITRDKLKHPLDGLTSCEPLLSDTCPTCERYSKKPNDIEVDDEELPDQELDSSWKDEW
ncbi:hypothetical protein QYM36_015230 [Artemia franciscana]|uniref:Uncharacterized protein n=1 Tax=Artemia franciscana TaxID=6661 RepID=A0AA88HL46_ARTSF|nr:hypothetical protein QYM36_015230 [Artemia franciscana]